MIKRFADDKRVSVTLSQTDIATLGCETVVYSAADLKNLLHDAAMMPMQRFSYDDCVDITPEEVYTLQSPMFQACN